MIFGNTVGGGGTLGKSVIIEGTDGTELVGVVVGVVTDKETIMTATANDVREGKVFASEDGIVTGTKRIPAYETTQASCFVLQGENYSIPLDKYDKYDYTKIQGIITKYNSNPLQRMSAEKVIIDDNVYEVNSSEVLSTITKNTETKSIDLNIVNNTEDIYIIYYFTYKEID